MYNWNLWRRERGRPEKLFKKIMAENFLNLMETVHSQIEQAQWTQNIRIMKKTTQRHTIIKLLKPVINGKPYK